MLNTHNYKGKILVLYYHNLGYPLRATNDALLYCFDKYSGSLCYYVNVAFGVPKDIVNTKFDLIIYHTLLSAKRSLPRRFHKIFEYTNSLKQHKCEKAIFAQDEYLYTDLLNKYIDDQGIKHVFSCATPEEWHIFYPNFESRGLKVSRVLPGYLEADFVSKIDELLCKNEKRDIDVFYRANRPSYALGRHAFLKFNISLVMNEKMKDEGLKLDISCDPKDVVLGFDWYLRLLRSKYTVGVESGASLLDVDGEISKAVRTYLQANPGATFEEVEEKCFKNMDYNVKYFAISPRHLEACATKTCQILMEGFYNGILKPGKHYVELKKDFSNLSEIVEFIKTDKNRNEIVNNAYVDIVKSGKYTYKSFVKGVLGSVFGDHNIASTISDRDVKVYSQNVSREKMVWMYIPLRSFIVKKTLSILPTRLYKYVESYMKRFQ